MKIFSLSLLFLINFQLKSSGQIISLLSYNFDKTDMIRTTDNQVVKKNGFGDLYLNIVNQSDYEIIGLRYDVYIYDIFNKQILKEKNLTIQPDGFFSKYGLKLHINSYRDWPFISSSSGTLLSNEKKKFEKLDNSRTLTFKIKIKEIIFRGSKSSDSNINRVITSTINRFEL
jgi:hypothetical protein